MIRVRTQQITRQNNEQADKSRITVVSGARQTAASRATEQHNMHKTEKNRFYKNFHFI